MMFRRIATWWYVNEHWLRFAVPLIALLIGIAIIFLSGGQKPIGSGRGPPQECGTGLAREFC